MATRSSILVQKTSWTEEPWFLLVTICLKYPSSSLQSQSFHVLLDSVSFRQHIFQSCFYTFSYCLLIGDLKTFTFKLIADRQRLALSICCFVNVLFHESSTVLILYDLSIFVTVYFDSFTIIFCVSTIGFSFVVTVRAKQNIFITSYFKLITILLLSPNRLYYFRLLMLLFKFL